MGNTAECAAMGCTSLLFFVIVYQLRADIARGVALRLGSLPVSGYRVKQRRNETKAGMHFSLNTPPPQMDFSFAPRLSHGRRGLF